MRSQVQPVFKDNIFEFRIDFQELTKEKLGMLIWSLELQGDLRHKLGMGKAIGFGSIEIEIIESHLVDLKAHYENFNLSGIKMNIKFNKFEFLNVFQKWIKEKQINLSFSSTVSRP